MQSSILAHIMDSIFPNGCLWIFVEHLEGMLRVMVEENIDCRLLDQAIANGYYHMACIHAKVQALVREYHLLLGYCHTTAGIIVVDDEME